MERNVVRLWMLLPILFLASAVCGQEPPKDKKVDDEKTAAKPGPAAVGKLVEQLKSSDFRTRDKAAEQLSKLEEVPAALREAEKSGDLEMRRRAQLIIAAISARLEEKAFQAMIADLHKIELDRFVRRMVTDEKFVGDKEWKVIAALTKAVTKRANDLGGRQYPVPDFDMTSLPLADLAVERVAFRGKRLLLNHYTDGITSVDGCVVLCTGTMPKVTGLDNSIIIVDGDFTRATGLDNCLLIVCGKIGGFTVVQSSIVLATGEFGAHMGFGERNELIGATGCDFSFLQVKNEKIRFAGSKDSVLVKTVPRTTGPTTSRVLDTDKGPLQMLRFSAQKIVPDDKLAWGKEWGGLAVAIAPAERPGAYLIRWKNVGKETLELQADRSHPADYVGRNDLLNHVFVKGANGKQLPARQSKLRMVGAPRRPNTVLLESGKT